ncbi:MAG: acetoin utilization protein AcuC [Proteobacteria bacterium]|nr:acetoin utilization protein AcuC [Pseudomonadota bacterium]
MQNAIFIGSDIYRDLGFNRGHPLAIPRVSFAIDLCRALNWFPDGSYLDSPEAEPGYLQRFHTPEYVAAMLNAEKTQLASPMARVRHSIGASGNPVFPKMFRRPATACGGGALAAQMVESGGIAYGIGGGQHHGRPDRASGFCYFNEPALTILTLLDQGASRVFYLDLDAHFGDAVQDAFHDDARVFTLSIHEDGRWPMPPGGDKKAPGGVLDRAGGASRNLPVPAGFNDAELAFLMDGVVLPLIQNFRPDAIFIQGGVDALADDPQSKLSLSNGALWKAISAVMPLTSRLIVSGGGGYNPFAVGRAFAGIWATLYGHDMPDRLPAAAEAVLAAVKWPHRMSRPAPRHWFESLTDPPNLAPIGDPVRALARETAEF